MIRLSAIRKSYEGPQGPVPVLRGIDLSIGAGEIFGVIGASGAGKSTLVRLINLLERPTEGEVFVAGRRVTEAQGAELRELRRSIGMVFQHFNLFSARTVAANVAYPLEVSGRYGKAEIAGRVRALLERVGLSDHAEKYPSRLSGGQKQRVGVARALACDPKVLLCDEATSALDPQTTRSVLDLLQRINRELGVTIVIITHEMDVIRRACDRVAVLDQGEVAEEGPVTQVFLHPRHEATIRLLRESEPDGGGFGEEAKAGQAQGRRLRLTLLGALAHEPILSRVSRERRVDCAVLAGRVGRIRETPYAQFVVSLFGAECEGALSDLRAAGVVVEALDAKAAQPVEAQPVERILHVV